MSRYIHTHDTHNQKAARIILPILFDFFIPKTILDVGCGIGTWLSVAKDLGIKEVIGVDGDYVDRGLLNNHLSNTEFISYDLTLHLDLERKFELVLCLEVAEHLPENSANVLIDTLLRHGDVILFSAAIPGQGGQNHLNEQWPDYWAKKFADHGYVFLDLIRPLIWENPQIEFWYKQNVFIVVKYSHELSKNYIHSFNSLIHPQLYDKKNTEIFDLKKRLKEILNGKLSWIDILKIIKMKVFK